MHCQGGFLSPMTHSLMMMVLSGGAVVIAGILLGYSADQISNRTGLGEMWTGWILLAAATSLPEFVTDVSAVKLHAANLAAGDLFGSSLTNMAILAVLVLVPFTRDAVVPVTERGGSDETGAPVLFSAWLAIVLTALGTLFTLLHSGAGFFGLRLPSLTLLVVWIAGTRVLFSRQHAAPVTPGLAAITTPQEASGLKQLVLPTLIFAVGSAIIFLAAPAFANCAQQFAADSGLGESFVGTWMLGFSTALPEFVTSMTACRLGAFDLAVANLYGSCAFNMVVFFPMDLASSRSVFSLLDPVLTLSGLLAIALMLVGLAAVAYRRHHVLTPNLSGGALLACYGFAVWILYAFRG
jgi:cation:H+ antiporter